MAINLLEFLLMEIHRFMCQNFCEFEEFRTRQLILLLFSCSCQGFLILKKKRVELMKRSGEKVGVLLPMSMSLCVGNSFPGTYLMPSWVECILLCTQCALPPAVSTP